MSFPVTSSRVLEDHPHRFVTVASDLALAPGYWPEQLECDLGNKLPLIRGKRIDLNGEFNGYDYNQSNGCITVTVFND